mmetsp:Transcript_33820/g.132881  ORF Transcript_33820/g.132881 Transcript_33820/m.132881 type:complete len:263 (+) Transcript_33820:1692-2480(+)
MADVWVLRCNPIPTPLGHTSIAEPDVPPTGETTVPCWKLYYEFLSWDADHIRDIWDQAIAARFTKSLGLGNDRPSIQVELELVQLWQESTLPIPILDFFCFRPLLVVFGVGRSLVELVHVQLIYRSRVNSEMLTIFRFPAYGGKVEDEALFPRSKVHLLDAVDRLIVPEKDVCSVRHVGRLRIGERKHVKQGSLAPLCIKWLPLDRVSKHLPPVHYGLTFKHQTIMRRHPEIVTERRILHGHFHGPIHFSIMDEHKGRAVHI